MPSILRVQSRVPTLASVPSGSLAIASHHSDEDITADLPSERDACPNDAAAPSGTGFWDREHDKLSKVLCGTSALHLASPIRTGDTSSAPSLVRRFVQSSLFEMTVSVVVLANTAFIGYQVHEFALRRGRPPSKHSQAVNDIIERTFFVIFTMELLLRLKAEGVNFVRSTNWRWNVFDTVLVVAMLFEVIIDTIGGSVIGSVSMLRILRLCRLMRLLRVVKVLRGLRELRIMLSSILSSVKPLCWVCLIFVAVLYIFGVALTAGVAEHLNDTEAWDKEGSVFLIHHFGTLEGTVLSLFEAMTGGISWGELFDATQDLSPAYPMIFLSFITFTLLGLLNIITGVFVETALGNSKADQESMILDEIEAKKELLHKLKILFYDIDIENCGAISLNQLSAALNDERMQAYLHAIGLSIDDAHCLFVLLDRDQQGKVETDEFLNGCLKLLGQASGMELAKVQLEGKWVVQNLNRLIGLVKGLQEKSLELSTSLQKVQRKLDEGFTI